jgi:MFS family permease
VISTRRYRALQARRGARLLAGASLLAWFALASLPLALVLAVRHSAGSMAAAGAAVGAFAAGAGLLAPLRGRLVDRYGGAALAAITTGWTLTMLVVGASTALRWPAGVSIAGAGAAGALAPPLVATARALWGPVAGSELERTGHALNASLGDASTVLGPLVAGATAAAAEPTAALVIPTLGPVAAAAMLRAVGIPRTRPSTRPRAGVLRASAGLRTLAVTVLPTWCVLGGLEVAGPAVALHGGRPELAAAPLAAFGAGSVLASLGIGASARARPAGLRYVAGVTLLALALLPLLVTDSLAWLCVVVATAGLGFGLLNVAMLQLLDDVVPRRHAVEALTWLSSVEGLGVAGGSALAGLLVTHGPGRALAVLALIAPFAAMLAAARRRTLVPSGADRTRPAVLAPADPTSVSGSPG